MLTEMGILGIVYTVKKLSEADKLDAKASKINVRAFEKTIESKEKVRIQNKKTEQSILKLVNRKKGIYQSSIIRFLDLYKDLQKINFEEGEGLKELQTVTLSTVSVQELKDMAGVSKKTLTDSQTLAAYIFTGIPGLIKKDSEMNLSSANIRSRQADIVEKQAESICIALNGVSERADKIADVLKNLNVLFMKSLKHTQEIANKNGSDKTKYTLAERESIRICFNFAKGIKDILDVPLLDKDGEITQKSLEIIQIGENFYNKMKEINYN